LGEGTDAIDGDEGGVRGGPVEGDATGIAECVDLGAGEQLGGHIALLRRRATAGGGIAATTSVDRDLCLRTRTLALGACRCRVSGGLAGRDLHRAGESYGADAVIIGY